MRPVFQHTFRKMAIPTFAWAFVMALTGAFVIIAFEGFVKSNQELLQQLLAQLPPALAALAGDAEAFSKPSGWLDAKYFMLLPLLLGIFAILTGSGLFAADEEEGRLELIAAAPLSRQRLFWSRSLALLAAPTLILLVSWISTAIAAAAYDYGITVALVVPFCNALLLTWMLGAFALFLSFLLPSRKIAATIGGAVLFLWYLSSVVGTAVADWKWLVDLTPLRYYHGGKAMDSVPTGAMVILAMMTAGLLIASSRLFERRDLRVAGEAPWKPVTLSMGLCGVAVGFGLLYGVSAWIGV